MLVVDKFGWTTSVVMARNGTSQVVNIRAGVVTPVHTMTMFPSHVLTQLKQLFWLEEEVHGLVVLKCFMLITGEPFVTTDLLMQQQKLFATLSDSDMLEEK